MSSSSILKRLLELPHAMKLELLDVSHPLTESCGEAFPHMPSLTNLTFTLGYPNVDFLQQLPNLLTLDLDCTRCSRPADMDRMMASFQSLTGLTELRLCGNGYGERPHTLSFTSARLASCLSHMPLLSSLHMMGTLGLESLHFLSSGGPVTLFAHRAEAGALSTKTFVARIGACPCAIGFELVAVGIGV